MQQQYRTPRDAVRSHTARSSTSSSAGSEAIPNTIVSNLKVVPPAVPAPAYVAVAAASQLVTDNQIPIDDEEINDAVLHRSLSNAESALFSAPGLAMINAFLDQLFYNFLLQAQGTSLAAIQSSIALVLKGKLARHAIANANEELEELLSDDADEDLAVAEEFASQGITMDTEAVFWRTRLRVMVYMRLGEMEDEDEEQYIEEAQARLSSAHGRKRISLNTGLVSWAAAIYLTSILEFVAEQCLSVAGQAAYDRVKNRKRQRGIGFEVEGEARVVVEESDVERIALSSTLGRLWRTWRKQLRKPHSRNVSGGGSVTSSGKPSRSKLRSEMTNGYSVNPDDLGSAKNNHVDVLDPKKPAAGEGSPTRRGSRGSTASEEGARVNTVRIQRISQRPRSLVIARRINGLEEDTKPSLPQLNESADLAARFRSQSLPSPTRNPIESPFDSYNFKSEAQSTDHKPEVPIINEDPSETATPRPPDSSFEPKTKVWYAGEVKNSHIKDTTSEGSGSIIERGDSPLSFLDRAAATRIPSPSAGSNGTRRSEREAASITKAVNVSGTESLTSIEEDGEQLRPVSPIGTPVDGPNNQASRKYQFGLGSNNQPWTAHHSSSKSSLREPALRSTQSFEHEERSSVRRLSESSSKHSKSARPSQEMHRTPSSNTGQWDHLEKDFKDFMATQGTVKYTLTPKTLQEIESKNPPRYKNDANKPMEQQQNERGPEVLTNAQQAVIANMNAGLKSYSPSSERREEVDWQTTPKQTQSKGRLNDTGAAAVPNVSGRTTSESWSGINEVGRVGSRELKATTSPSRPVGYVYAGWTSGRTSLESPKSNGTNGGSSHVRPPTVSAARKTSASTLEPRDAGRAIAGQRGENDDLVAFLRSTGPGSNGSYGRNGESYTTTSSLPNRTSSSKSPSMNGSVNSNTGLLGSVARGAVPVRQGLNKSQEPPMAEKEEEVEAEIMPVRQRRRVKDPYALPSDDEGEDEVTELRGETLMDFLRHVDPPPHVVAGDSKSNTMSSASLSQQTTGRAVKNKASVRSLWKKKVNT